MNSRECLKCQFGTLDNQHIICSKKDKRFVYGSYVNCDEKVKRTNNDTKRKKGTKGSEDSN